MLTPCFRFADGLRAACCACAMTLANAAVAGGMPLDPQVRAAIEAFVRGQAAGLPGTVTVRVADPASGTLPSCARLQPFLPEGVVAWGRISVGVRCGGERPWTRFLAATVQVEGDYLAAAHTIQSGQALQVRDVEIRHADLTRLPRSILAEPSQLAGMVAMNPIAAGAPVRADMLRGQLVIRQGQSVRVVSQGDGFVVSTQARALTNASTGALVQVKTAAGQVLSGSARGDGTVNMGK